MGPHLSSLRLTLSLWSAHLRSQHLRYLAAAFSLSLGRVHCQSTEASCVRGSVHWALVSRAACTLRAKKHSRHKHLCAALGAREWKHSRTCASPHRAAAFYMPTLW